MIDFFFVAAAAPESIYSAISDLEMITFYYYYYYQLKNNRVFFCFHEVNQ